MKKIILVDFSKVISPVGISRFLSGNLEKYLTLSKEEIRDIYKKNIGELVIGKYSIFDFLDEIEGFLKEGFTKDDLKITIHNIPDIDEDMLDVLTILKEKYRLVLVSDVYRELGLELKEKLREYFDDFIFSFEEKAKKSHYVFWKRLSEKININDISLFIDDKKTNILLAQKFKIDGIVFKTLNESRHEIFKRVFKHKDNIILGA